MIKRVAALAAAALCAVASAQAPAPASGDAAAPASPHTVTGNFGLASDYRFRGISQSWGLPAVQGGVDYTHASGFYLGNWNSSVSSNSYNNGASLEVDLYGGYRFEPVKDLTVDVGALVYVYPGARLNSAPGTPTGEKYDNTELYVGLTQGPFTAKLSYAMTDYF
ncbi:MAG: TorF family putative porin, partial [Lacisediminimonas sp.]|nr:TorF family putative porin [Lacisediminimonas sp.]